MKKTYLIDGYNLIHADRRLAGLLRSGDAEAARQGLCTKLGTLARPSVNVIVVFDGVSKFQSHDKRIQCVFSGQRLADDVIRARVAENEASAKFFTIVSSDLEIVRFAKKCGTEVVSSQEFLSLLHSSKQVTILEEKPSEGEGDIRRLAELFRSAKND